jgi:hypothetical protein
MTDYFVQLRNELIDIVRQLNGTIEQLGSDRIGISYSPEPTHILPKQLKLHIVLPTNAHFESPLFNEIDDIMRIYGYSLDDVERVAYANRDISIILLFNKTGNPLEEVKDIL